jgi:hypothetical protein
MHELFANLAAASARGDLNDPGPASMGAHNLGGMINLQTALAYLRDDPRFYNPLTWLLCAPLLIVLAIAILRRSPTPQTRDHRPQTLLPLAAIAILTLLPVYHRQYDAKLLLLAVPGCALLWSRANRVAARFAAFLTLAAILFTGDLTWALLLGLIANMGPQIPGSSAHLAATSFFLAVPFTLLAVGAFYIWACFRRPALEP